MKEEFIQSGRFETPIPGYYFGTGEMGLGYYKMNGNGDGIKQEEMVDEKEGRKKRRVDGGALLREMEEQARGGAREMDGKGLKRLIQNLEKKVWLWLVCDWHGPVGWDILCVRCVCVWVGECVYQSICQPRSM